MCEIYSKLKIKPKKVFLFLEIGRMKKILSFTRSHSRMCIRIYIFNFKKQINEQKQKQEYKKSKRN